MLTLNNLGYGFGSRWLYRDLSFQVHPRDKYGLIGANGTGKSTLLRLIVGEFQPTEGAVERSRECTLGFLNQDLLSYESDKPIREVAMEAFERALQVEVEIAEILAKMETDYSDQMVEKLGNLQEEFERLDGYTMQSKADEVLEGLGFKTADLARPLRTFSGGWRMRVMLAKILLQKPALLLLDEPTNHLDLPSIEWLEVYLKNYPGAVIIVSHDREFLDKATEKTAEIYGGQLDTYAGNYSFYVEEKVLREEIQRNAFRNQQQQIKQTEQFISRFRAQATKARQVQSKIKQLDKLDRVNDVEDHSQQISFRFRVGKPSGKVLCELKDASKSYGDLEVIKEANCLVERGSKIAIVGANGKGKSTLMRMVAGDEDMGGERIEGHNLNQAFFAQHQLEALHLENTILEELNSAAPDHTELELRKLLGNFLFSGEDVEKNIKVLSGGERSRVALTKVLLSAANFLLLDEPTNHLDIASVEMLKQAVQQYEGTAMIVSHDRHFVREVATEIWWIEDGVLRTYPGTYDEFLAWQVIQAERMAGTTQAAQPKKAEPKPATDERRSQSAKKQRELKALEQGLEKLEAKVAELERKKGSLEAALAKPDVYSDGDQLHKLSSEHRDVERSLQREQEKWEELAAQIDSLTQELQAEGV